LTFKKLEKSQKEIHRIVTCIKEDINEINGKEAIKSSDILTTNVIYKTKYEKQQLYVHFKNSNPKTKN
jgi:hypothetical protein